MKSDGTPETRAERDRLERVQDYLGNACTAMLCFNLKCEACPIKKSKELVEARLEPPKCPTCGKLL